MIPTMDAAHRFKLPARAVDLARVINHEAKADKPCPSNVELAGRLGCSPRYVATLMRTLTDAGVLYIAESRRGRYGGRAVEVVPSRRVAAMRERPRVPLDPTAQRCLGIIEEAFQAGQACPSNQALADYLGLSRPETVSDVIARLERHGLVRVLRPHRGKRAVTIVQQIDNQPGEEIAA